MTEEEFLTSYDPTAFERPSVTVDLVLMTILDGAPAVLLKRRGEHPFLGDWALPGSFVRMDEDLDEAARRILASEARMDGAYIEQLYTFGAPQRDPRTRVITVAYFALLPAEEFASALRAADDLVLAHSRSPGAARRAGRCRRRTGRGRPLPLAFDHAEILGLAVRRLRGKLDYSPIAFALLPELFTLRQLQDVHEAILGVRLNKPAFRRRMQDKGWVEGTGARETGASYRPAELYRFKPQKGE